MAGDNSTWARQPGPAQGASFVHRVPETWGDEHCWVRVQGFSGSATFSDVPCKLPLYNTQQLIPDPRMRRFSKPGTYVSESN